MPEKLPVESHPVREWNPGRSLHNSGPSFAHISWIGINRQLLPVPILSHSWSQLRNDKWKWWQHKTATSVSGEAMIMCLHRDQHDT